MVVLIRFSIFLSFIVLFFACADTSQQDRIISKPGLNPNGESELALLMRDMETEVKRIRDQIERGEAVTAQRDFSLLLTAVPTREDMKPVTFPEYANGFLDAYERMASVPPGMQQTAYEDLVNSCLNCHQQSCKGPIVRISKLYIPTEK